MDDVGVSSYDSRLVEVSHIPISSLDPSRPPPEESTINAVVSLLWPYSSSSRSFALLLADPDFRQRSNKGQVRIQLTGSVADAVAKTHVGIGDLVKLHLAGARWVEDAATVKTPGRSVDANLLFKSKILLQIQRDGKTLPIVEVDHVESPPPRSVLDVAVSTPISQTLNRQNLQSTDRSESWKTPARFRNSFGRISSISSNAGSLFGDELAFDEYQIDERPVKRSRVWRHSGNWRLLNQELTSSDEEVPETASRLALPQFDGAADSDDDHRRGVDGDTPNLIETSQSPSRNQPGENGTAGPEIFELPVPKQDLVEEERSEMDTGTMGPSPLPPIRTDLDALSDRADEHSHRNWPTPSSPSLRPVASALWPLVSPLSSFQDAGLLHQSRQSEYQALSPSENLQLSGIIDAEEEDIRGEPLLLLGDSGVSYNPPNPRSQFIENASSLSNQQTLLDLPSAVGIVSGSSQSHTEAEDTPGAATVKETNFETIDPRSQDSLLVFNATEPMNRVTEDQSPGLTDVIRAGDEAFGEHADADFNESNFVSNLVSDRQEFEGAIVPTIMQEDIRDTGDSHQEPPAPIALLEGHIHGVLADASAEDVSHDDDLYSRPEPLPSEEDVETISILNNPSPKSAEMQTSVLPEIGQQPTPDASQEPVPLIRNSSSTFHIVDDILDGRFPPTPPTSSIPSYMLQKSQIDPARPIAEDERAMAVSMSSRRSSNYRSAVVPEVISTWFTPRRRSSILDDARTEPEGEVAKALSHTVGFDFNSSYEASQSDLIKADSSIPPRTFIEGSKGSIAGFRTASSYYSALASLGRRVNNMSQIGESLIDVIAVVSSTAETGRAKSDAKDYYTNFKVTDNSVIPETLQVQIFRPFKSSLPTIDAGDVILLRSFSVKSRNRQPFLLSGEASAWYVWRYSQSISEKPPGQGESPVWASRKKPVEPYEQCRGPPVELGKDEREHAHVMRSWWESLLVHGGEPTLSLMNEQDANAARDDQNESRAQGIAVGT